MMKNALKWAAVVLLFFLGIALVVVFFGELSGTASVALIALKSAVSIVLLLALIFCVAFLDVCDMYPEAFRRFMKSLMHGE